MAQQLHDKLLQLFTSRVRLKLLKIFLTNQGEMYYVRQLTRMAEEEVNAVRRELKRLEEVDLLTAEKRGNRLYYRANSGFPFYYDLVRMIGKITGLGADLYEKRSQLGSLKYAMLSARFVQGQPSGPNEIDVLVVGRVSLDELQKLIRGYEATMEREINYTVMTEDELRFRKDRGDAFIRAVLTQPQVVVVGDEKELNS